MIFNNHHPQNFHGHSLSVSDIVKFDNDYFFVDSFGFKEVSFVQRKSLESQIAEAKTTSEKNNNASNLSKDTISDISR